MLYFNHLWKKKELRVNSLVARRTLIGSQYSWWSGNARFIELSGKFLGAHVVLDAMILIGRGQRELILGDRHTGKTSIGLDMVAALIAHRMGLITNLCCYIETRGEVF